MNKVYNINSKVITIKKGDLTEFDGDALINAANNYLYMGGGIAYVIKERAGEEIEKEAISKGPIAIGDAIDTKGYNLKVKYVVHAATMGLDFKTNEEYIRKSCFNSLKLAEKLEIQSIAFPALGAGVGKYPIKKVAKIMLDEIISFLKVSSYVHRVYIYLINEEFFNIFIKYLDSIQLNS